MAAAGLPVAWLHVGERVPARHAPGQVTGACHDPLSLAEHKMSIYMFLTPCISMLPLTGC